MSGRLGHIAGNRRVGHVPVNGIRQTNYAYGFGGCVFWLDANANTNTKTNGAAVSSWADKILGYEYVQASGSNQPVFVASEATLNNFPAINFSTSKCLAFSGNRTLPYGVDHTLACVLKQNLNSAATNTDLLAPTISSSGGARIITCGTGAGQGFGIVHDSGTYYSTVRNTNAHINIITGSSIITDGTAVTTGMSYTFAGGLLTIGRTVDVVGAASCYATVAEILIFNRKFSDAEAILLSDNLNKKYAIY